MSGVPDILSEVAPRRNYFLGLDFSTQQLKAVVVDEKLKVLHEAAVNFDRNLPEYRTSGGVKKNGSTITAPTVMWVKALDLLMDQLKITGLDFQDISAISGAGQQHGSVYWRKGAEKVLSTLDPTKFMFLQLANCFSVQDSPVWMDSSTQSYCETMEKKLGGPQKLADLTGSRAYERFTGHQIAKVLTEKAELYFNTEMCAPDLKEKLDKPVVAHTCLGPISSYFVERYSFDPSCQVVAFTGDNPASLAGMCLEAGDIAISLGTSDTVFLWLSGKPTPSLEGHVFCNPVDPDAYMALLCFKNGSLTRERIRNVYANRSWDQFDALLACTPPGNHGYVGMFFDEKEITPKIQGTFRFNASDQRINAFEEPATEVRALVEGQLLAKRVHAERLGFSTGESCRVFVTGGASNNKSILQVLSDVFNAHVYTQDTANSTCLGSAYRAAHGLAVKESDVFIPFNEFMADRRPNFSLLCRPRLEAAQLYDSMAARYATLESSVLTQL
ncbi:xylulose kinase-like isoform X2 [Daphnia pulex]|uniref:xylulose kinase-like isoform X2 n=1 Tax=Daphnia pulex TaxID=6669 RepID=UPI001EDEBF70|nr:xylulose kinase-like isoform X2 [Daphnia pulex]